MARVDPHAVTPAMVNTSLITGRSSAAPNTLILAIVGRPLRFIPVPPGDSADRFPWCHGSHVTVGPPQLPSVGSARGVPRRPNPVELAEGAVAVLGRHPFHGACTMVIDGERDPAGVDPVVVPI